LLWMMLMMVAKGIDFKHNVGAVLFFPMGVAVRSEVI